MNAQSTHLSSIVGSPRKLFYRIKEVSRMTGLKAHVLRYWESEFPELAPEKDSSDQRRYRDKDIRTILAIRKLLYEDRFTIKGARKQLRKELANFRDQELPPSPPIAKVEPPAPVEPSETVQAEALRAYKPVNLYKRALSENLSLIKKEVGELLALLNA